MNRLSVEQQRTVIHLLVEGNSIRSTERLTGVHRDTIMRLLVRVGGKCREFLDQRMRHLHLSHLECDEIWTFVLCKQRHLDENQRDDPALGDQFAFIAIDEMTKLIPSFLLGKRTRENTEMFAQDLADRIVHPQLGAFGRKPMISTDGFAAYPGAIDLAFATTVHYGQLIKDFAESEQPGRYGPPELCGAGRFKIIGDFDPNDLCTSHVERSNLTIRTFMRRFTRLSLGFSKKLENLAAALALHVAHYNFCRWHRTLKKTPAMAAGLTGHPWSMQELLSQQ